MLTFPVDQWIGNAAAVLSGVWGAVTQRSTHSGYSRTAIYQHAERVVQAVANEQAGGISYEALWAENERLKAENEALWQAWSEVEELSECKQHELVSAGSAMGLSLTQIVILLAIVLPSRMVPSRATVGRWVQQSAQQSRGILEVLDRACQGLVLVLCLDEIFFRQHVTPRSLVLITNWKCFFDTQTTLFYVHKQIFPFQSDFIWIISPQFLKLLILNYTSTNFSLVVSLLIFLFQSFFCLMYLTLYKLKLQSFSF